MVNTRLKAIRDSCGLRHDWHEPDEAGVSAHIVGHKLDNACGDDLTETTELKVCITKTVYENGEDKSIILGVFNLANLLADACKEG